jgi:dolichol-phosphate mannosyltransferase
MRIFFHVSLILTPLPLLSALLFLVGMMSILMGLVAEMMVRTYYESQGARAYLVRELINFDRSTLNAAAK